MRSQFLYKSNPEIEKTFRLRSKKQKLEEQGRKEPHQIWREEEVTKEGRLGILLPPGVQGITSSIAHPNVERCVIH